MFISEQSITSQILFHFKFIASHVSYMSPVYAWTQAMVLSCKRKRVGRFLQVRGETLPPKSSSKHAPWWAPGSGVWGMSHWSETLGQTPVPLETFYLTVGLGTSVEELESRAANREVWTDLLRVIPRWEEERRKFISIQLSTIRAVRIRDSGALLKLLWRLMS